jgi:hypothetical protein
MVKYVAMAEYYSNGKHHEVVGRDLNSFKAGLDFLEKVNKNQTITFCIIQQEANGK